MTESQGASGITSGDGSVTIRGGGATVDLSVSGGGGGITLGGDLGGTLTSQIVKGIQTVPVSATTPTTGQVLVLSGGVWTPMAIPLGITSGSGIGVASTSGIFTISNTGVLSFNARTGAVSLTAADVESTFNAKGDLFLGTGSGTGTILPIGTTGYVLTVSGGTAVWAAATGGVTSFNTRTGAVTLAVGDVEGLFTADKQIISGTGSGTGELIDLLAALKEYFTADNQVIAGTGSGTGEVIDIGALINEQFTADNQLRAGTGSGTGELINGAAFIEEQFTADQQIFSGTGAGTGELIDLLTALGEYYADDQVFQGTGAGTGAMTNPTSGYGLKADSMEELAPAVSLTTLEGDQGGSGVSLTAGSFTTTNSVTLVPGTYLVLAVAGVIGQTSAGSILHQIAVGTATATGAPALPRDVNTWNAITTAAEALPLQTITMIVTCTVGGTLLQQIKPPTGMTGTLVSAASTNLVAVQIA